MQNWQSYLTAHQRIAFISIIGVGMCKFSGVMLSIVSKGGLAGCGGAPTKSQKLAMLFDKNE